MQRTIIAIPSDTHAGSTVGLIPPGQWQLDNGGYYIPSRYQNELYNWWRHCWEVVGQQRRGARLVVVHNGDAVDGVHHETTELVTTRLDEQERIHTACMDEGLRLAGWSRKRGDSLYYVRGTQTHVGPGGRAEEVIARDLGAVPILPGSREQQFRDGRYSWSHLRRTVYGQVVDIAHQGPAPGRRAWTEENSLRSLAKSLYFKALDRGQKPVRFWVRSHRHRYLAVEHEGQQGHTTMILTPAFQLKTEYSHQVGNDDAVADIGMVILEMREDGVCGWHCEHMAFEEEAGTL